MIDEQHIRSQVIWHLNELERLYNLYGKVSQVHCKQSFIDSNFLKQLMNDYDYDFIKAFLQQPYKH